MSSVLQSWWLRMLRLLWSAVKPSSALSEDRSRQDTPIVTNIVRQVTHHTPKSIIDQYVILQLKMQLKRSSQSIKEVAWEYHFADTSFFCRYFKKHTGITPQQIRDGAHFKK